MVQKELIVVVGDAHAGRDEWVERHVWNAKAGSVEVVHLEGGRRSLHWGCKQLRAALAKPRVETVIFCDASAGLPGARTAAIAACREAHAPLFAWGVHITRAAGPPSLDTLHTAWAQAWQRAKRATAEAFTSHASEKQHTEDHVVRAKALLSSAYSPAASELSPGSHTTRVVPPAITEGFDRLTRAAGVRFPCFELAYAPPGASTAESEASCRPSPVQGVPFDAQGLLLDASVLVHGGRLRPGVANLIHFFFSSPTSTAAPAARRVLVILLSGLPDLQKGWCDDTVTMHSAVRQLCSTLRGLNAPYPIYLYTAATGGGGVAPSDDPPSVCSIVASPPSTSSSSRPALKLNRLTVSDVAYMHYAFKLCLQDAFVVSSTALVGNAANHLQKLCGATGVRYLDADKLFGAVASGAQGVQGSGLLAELAAESPVPHDPTVQGFVPLLAGLAVGQAGVGVGAAAATPLAHYYPLLFGCDRNVGLCHSTEGVREHTAVLATAAQRSMSLCLIHGPGTDIPDIEQALLSKDAVQQQHQQQHQAPAGVAAQQQVQQPPALAPRMLGRESTGVQLFGEVQLGKGSKFFKKGMTSVTSVTCKPQGGAAAPAPVVLVAMGCLAADGVNSYAVQLQAETAADPHHIRITSYPSITCDCGKDVRLLPAAQQQQQPTLSSFCRHAAACVAHLSTAGADLPDDVSRALTRAHEPSDIFDVFFGKKKKKPDGQPEPGAEPPASPDDLNLDAVPGEAAAAATTTTTAAAADPPAPPGAAPEQQKAEGLQQGSLTSGAFGIFKRIREFCSPVVGPAAAPGGPPPEAAAAAAGGAAAHPPGTSGDAAAPPLSLIVGQQQQQQGAPTSTLPAFMLGPPGPKGRGGKSKKRARGVGGPAAPKRPLSGYLFFMQARRAEVAQAHPGCTAPEMAKLLGKQWMEMGPEGKAPFLQQADAAREKYKEEMAVFEREHPEACQEAAAAAKPARAAKRKAAAEPADPAPAPPLNEEDAFLDKFQRQSSWQIEDGRWVHAGDSLSSLGGGTDMFFPAPPPRGGDAVAVLPGGVVMGPSGLPLPPQQQQQRGGHGDEMAPPAGKRRRGGQAAAAAPVGVGGGGHVVSQLAAAARAGVDPSAKAKKKKRAREEVPQQAVLGEEEGEGMSLDFGQIEPLEVQPQKRQRRGGGGAPGAEGAAEEGEKLQRQQRRRAKAPPPVPVAEAAAAAAAPEATTVVVRSPKRSALARGLSDLLVTHGSSLGNEAEDLFFGKARKK